MLALCRAPYRIFPQNDVQPEKNPPNILVYCLPSSVTEYLGFSDEASTVRSKLLNTDSDCDTVVAIYDCKTDSFVGGNGTLVLDAIGGNDAATSVLVAASLEALSQLDQLAAVQLGPDKRKDVVIVVGSGGREHALAVALAKSPLVENVICCTGNGGTAVEAGKISNVVNGKQDNATVLDLVKRVRADMVVVGPEAPLVDGLVDEMAVAYPNVRVFGPTKAAAELEASKVRLLPCLCV